jgi:5-hydroxyisourate hydrolase-like protein (transthyretin family)
MWHLRRQVLSDFSDRSARSLSAATPRDRSHPGARWRVVLAVVVVASLLGADFVLAQSVNGRVLDDGTGTGIDGVRVVIVKVSGEAVQSAVTAKDGRFQLSVPVAGEYRVRAERLGYVSRTTPLLALVAPDTVRIEVRLATSAVSLPPVTVVGRGGRVTLLDPYLEKRGYYDRKVLFGRQGEGSGIFLDGDALRRTASEATDLLRDVPGIHVVAAGGTKYHVAGRWAGCPPDMFVDGTFVGRAGSEKAREAMPPAADVEAIEVYPGMSAPVQYLRFMSEGCGVVLFWTGIRR